VQRERGGELKAQDILMVDIALPNQTPDKNGNPQQPFHPETKRRKEPLVLSRLEMYANVNVQMDPLIEGLKEELGFILGHIKPQDTLVAGV
jgi:hypothetical protein